MVSNTQAGAQTISLMSDLAQDGALGKQTSLRIALCLAQQGLSIFPIETLRDSGRLVGMNGAEMTANQQGTSHDAKGTACLKFVQSIVQSIVRNPMSPSVDDLSCMAEVGYSPAEIVEVMAQVSLNILLSRMALAILPLSESLNYAQNDSRQLMAP